MLLILFVRMIFSVTSLCLSNDYSATGQGLPGRPPQMVTTSSISHVSLLLIVLSMLSRDRKSVV